MQMGFKGKKKSWHLNFNGLLRASFGPFGWISLNNGREMTLNACLAQVILMHVILHQATGITTSVLSVGSTRQGILLSLLVSLT